MLPTLTIIIIGVTYLDYYYYWCYLPWLLLLLVLPTLTSAWAPLQFLRSLEPEFTGFTYSSLHWNPLFLRVSSYILLLCSRTLLHEDSLFILWFTALGICLFIDLGWFEPKYFLSFGLLTFVNQSWQNASSQFDNFLEKYS